MQNKLVNYQFMMIFQLFSLTLYLVSKNKSTKMKANKILFITQEINPYVPESPLTKLGRELPLGTLEQNREIRAFMPKWGNINERRNQLHPVIRLSGMNLIIDDIDHSLEIKVASVSGTRMQVYFIDNEDFFGKRLEVCDAKGIEYTDNIERAVFYARGVLETVKKLHWTPDVIHCQGWMSALVPLYLKKAYNEEPSFRNSNVVFSITDDTRTLSTGDNLANIIEFRDANETAYEEWGKNLTPIQLTMLAIKFADGVDIATDNVNPELLKYAKKCEKPILNNAHTDTDKYIEFFDFVYGQNHCENNPDEY